MNLIKVLIFDFDGLVFDTETYDLESFKLLYSRYETSFPLEQWLVSVGSKLHFNPYEKLITEQPLLRLDDLRKERMEIYKSIIHNQSPRDGVVEYIEEARKHQLQIALASSSTKDWVMYHLNCIQLQNEFDCIYTTDDVNEVKPSPELYQKVLGHYQIKPNEALVFEDSPNGSLAAIRAGIKCIVVPNQVTEKMSFDNRISRKIHSMKEVSLESLIK